jgi:tRNA uridine 5-carboxymethylaminomethyl modification enzyme
VMIDDLVTKELTEPYRLLTSRAEHRLLLRHDNADLRLSPIGYELGLIDKARYEAVEAKRHAIAAELDHLSKTYLVAEKLDDQIHSFGLPPMGHNVSALEFLRRTEINYPVLARLGYGNPELNADCVEQVEIEAKYHGYIERQHALVQKMQRIDERRIPDWFDYAQITGLRFEARQKLVKFRPQTLGQASRIDGVTPADVFILMIHLEKSRQTEPKTS